MLDCSHRFVMGELLFLFAENKCLFEKQSFEQ